MNNQQRNNRKVSATTSLASKGTVANGTSTGKSDEGHAGTGQNSSEGAGEEEEEAEEGRAFDLTVPTCQVTYCLFKQDVSVLCHAFVLMPSLSSFAALLWTMCYVVLRVSMLLVSSSRVYSACAS